MILQQVDYIFAQLPDLCRQAFGVRLFVLIAIHKPSPPSERDGVFNELSTTLQQPERHGLRCRYGSEL